MPDFNYRDSQLYVEKLPLKQIAKDFSTPCYVYSKHTIEKNWTNYDAPLKASNKPYKLFYAVKANSNIAILNILAKLGSGFDVVSGGEIDRVLAAGGKAKDLVFSGVGKSNAEINKSIDLGIHSLHIESEAELLAVQDLAKAKNKVVNIAIRINPDISANSHPYISTGNKENKFGIDYTKALTIYTLAANLPNLKIRGVSCHIGSQITTTAPFLSAIDQVLKVIDLLAENDIKIEYLNIGGGLGVCYKAETPPTPAQYIQEIMARLKDRNLEIHFEPGRSIVAEAGILLTKVEYLKTSGENNFAIVDAAMNDLMRPSLYQSYHEVVPLEAPDPKAVKQKYNIVGPVCESGDFLAKDRMLNLQTNDLLAIKTAGAYGFSMSSNYNTRPRCPEILVDGAKAHLIRKRETVDQLLQNENLVNDQ
jgi:diaminopimelate decarboxylase